MNILYKSLCSGTLAMSLIAGALAPAAAAPPRAPISQWSQSDVIQIHSTRQQTRRAERRQERRAERRQERRAERRQERRQDRFERRNGRYYYNGNPGYEHRRSGYRQYNGYWFPAAAFVVSVIIGGSHNNSSAHVSWCYDRYRTYRASDDTFQPYHGPRRRCRSPYSY